MVSLSQPFPKTTGVCLPVYQHPAELPAFHWGGGGGGGAIDPP